MDVQSKSAKKNQKRRQKKRESRVGHTTTEDLPMTAENMLSELKKELVIAKDKHDYKKSTEIREQIWVLTDMCAGVKTDIPDGELQKIIKNIPFMAKDPADESVGGGDSGSMLSEPEKELRKLRKKLKQIEELKLKQARGEKIEVNQLEKIASEERLRGELREIEDLLVSITLR